MVISHMKYHPQANKAKEKSKSGKWDKNPATLVVRKDTSPAMSRHP